MGIFSFSGKQVWDACPEGKTHIAILLLWKNICCRLQKRHIATTEYFSRIEPIFILLMNISIGFERVRLVYWIGLQSPRISIQVRIYGQYSHAVFTQMLGSVIMYVISRGSSSRSGKNWRSSFTHLIESMKDQCVAVLFSKRR